MLEIFGVPFSAHTRKVLLALREKNLAYELVPVVPLAPPSGWRELSPLGKIPGLRTPDITVADSSVICQYLERVQPAPALYPSEATAFARALWFEEFAGGALAPHVLHGLLMQRVFAPRFLQRAPDEALIKRSLEQELPPEFAYLEGQIQGAYLVGSSLTIADISVVSMLLNSQYAGEQLTAYPKLQRYLQGMVRRPAFQQAFATELPAAEQIPGLDLRALREAIQG